MITQAAIESLTLISDLECLRDNYEILLKQRKDLREALMAIKVEHLNNRIVLSLPIHGLMENTLENTKNLP